jgi:hypothetical protein
MKAEHRKELETNVLADRMGRLLDTVKQKPQRGTVGWVILGVVVVVVVFLTVRWYRVQQVEKSDAWLDYYLLPYTQDVRGLLENNRDKMQGKAVRFDQASVILWDGITKLGADPGAREKLHSAKRIYTELREECEGDPALVPEAIYGQALAEESLAIEDRKHLDAAIDYYKELADEKYRSTSFGKLAEKRLEILNDPTKLEEVSKIYQDIERRMPAFPLGGKKK